MLRKLTMTRLTTHLTTLCVALLIACSVSADTIKIKDLPKIDGVIVIGVKDGKLEYRTNAGNSTTPLEDVESLSIEAVPAFGTGLTALNEGQLRAAQRSFTEVWGNARDAWVRQYAGFYLAQVYDQRKEPVEAARIYVKLVSDKADPFFISKPPLASLAEADEDEKGRIKEQIMAVIAGTQGKYRESLQTYLGQVTGEAAPVIPDDPKANKNPSAKLIAGSKVLIPKEVWKIIDRADGKHEKWDGLRLLIAGENKKAVESIKPWLNNAGDLPEKLFILGRAQLALAEETKDRDGYLDAGLTLMRIVVHFSRDGQSHPLVAPARLEVAYIQKMIEREDIYKRMLFEENLNLIIDDAEKYPHYRKRYYEIIGEEVPSE